MVVLMNEYKDIIDNAKANAQKTKSINDVDFDVGNIKYNNEYNTKTMEKPSDVGHRYIDKNYYDQNKAYNDFSKKVDDFNFESSFDKAMNKGVGSNIEGMKATNTAIANSKGSVNELIPELMSKVSDNVDDTIENVTGFFQKKFNDMSMQEINNYAKISDILAQKSGLDVQTEQDLLKQWSINKEMEYSLKGLEMEKEANKSQSFFNKLQTGIQAVGTVASMVALFI